MNKIILLLLLITQYGFAAQFKLVGRVERPINEFIIFQNQDVLSGLIKKDTVVLQNGSFSYSINKTNEAFFEVFILVDSMRKLNVIGYEGYQLNINFLQAPNRPIIIGKMARIQQFATNDNACFAKIYAAYEIRNPDFTKKEFLRTDFYFKIHDSITNDRIDNLIAYFQDKQSPIETSFVSSRKLGFLYSNLFYKQSYPKPPYEKFKFYQILFKVNSDYTYAFSEIVDFNNPNLIYNSDYNHFIYSFLLSELEKRRTKYNIPFSFSSIIDHGFSLIDELSANPTANYQLKLLFSSSLINEVERSKQVKETEQLLEALRRSNLKKSLALQNLHIRLAYLIKYNKFKKGNIAPDFTLFDTLNREVKLADLKGKRIVIDVAASWCAPCIAGIPAWNKMIAENKDPETIFIFLSLDNTKTESLMLFNKHKPSGQLLFAGNGGFTNEFAKAYEISVLPNKIVIDKSGKIESYFY